MTLPGRSTTIVIEPLRAPAQVPEPTLPAMPSAPESPAAPSPGQAPPSPAREEVAA
jgi:hypothetical protein